MPSSSCTLIASSWSPVERTTSITVARARGLGIFGVDQRGLLALEAVRLVRAR